MASEGDVERVTQFVYSVFNVLQDALNEHEDWFTVELAEDFRLAWQELAIWFQRLGPLSLDSTLFDTLPDVGLSGAQLNLKLDGYNHAYERYSANPGPRLLCRVLRWADVLLGSLVRAVPALEPLKEIKEAFEVALAEAQPG